MVPSSGPTNARIMIVGEAPGETEVSRREPFVGASGQELNRMLHEAGIGRLECFLTNVCREQPPDNDMSKWISTNKKCPTPGWVDKKGKWVHPYVSQGMDLLEKELLAVKPNVIIAFGNTALWALTGKWGIKSWRGSLLQTPQLMKVVPAYHPAYILRDWAARQITVNDLKRAQAQSKSPEMPRSDYNFVIRPSFNAVMEYLNEATRKLEADRLGPGLGVTISCDIETRAGHIACLGLALNKTEAICLPLMCVENENGYWSFEEEVAIVSALRSLLTHPAARTIGQNFIYDSQYIWRWWHFVPRFARDTMLGHHVCFAGTPKGLDYLSSMYCEQHTYWKDEGKTWDPKHTGEEQLWQYNCKDCVITFECDEAIQATVDKLGLRGPHDFQMSMFWPVLQTMIRGLRIDHAARKGLQTDLATEMAAVEAWFQSILGHPLNPRSAVQMKKLFYEDLKQPTVFSRAKKGKARAPTLDDDALNTIGKREPCLRPVTDRIAAFRSMGVLLAAITDAKLDLDQRMRCSYNIAGTETFRLSSSENAFGSGLNLQNVTRGSKADETRAYAPAMPNLRKLYVPDPGHVWFDADLDRADLQVVVSEANDEKLRAAMGAGVDMHLYNMRVVHGIDLPDDEIVESHPRCAEHKERYYAKRHQTKEGVHATNYLCQPRTLAITLGVSVAEAERFQKRWFSEHPGILQWHTRVLNQLRTTHAVTNRFGYRRFYFDRLDSVAAEALAWIPQSTVAITINRIWHAIYEQLPAVQVLLQVHDSLAGQFPADLVAECRSGISRIAAATVIPYPVPLVIPLGIKTSATSWGDCK